MPCQHAGFMVHATLVINKYPTSANNNSLHHAVLEKRMGTKNKQITIYSYHPLM